MNLPVDTTISTPFAFTTIDNMDLALTRLIELSNTNAKHRDYFSLAQEDFGRWTVMGLGAEYFEIRLLPSHATFDIEMLMPVADIVVSCSISHTMSLLESVRDGFMCMIILAKEKTLMRK